MPRYDQLLLEFGGGVINAHSQSEAYKKDACVAIGLGGTGIAALKRLKKNVYQQLLPDDPEAPVPTYSHIQFIAVDADNIDPGHGKGKLSNSEMFSIKMESLGGVLGTEKGRRTVESDARMSWMDIKNITQLNTPEGAGGIRQVGRYLLISKAEELKLKIQLACTSAMQAAHTNSVTVYIFAGISGGTGSGCFIDTCYIVRQLMNDNAWAASGKIMGFFFLPDVVMSKKEVASVPSSVKYNNDNGYAAMKELDYLMNLELAEDRFYQKYGSFTIDTQEPPVDMCHLISAMKANGKLQPDGFDYCINVAADYVMSYLIDVTDMPDDGTDDKGLTLRGHLANVNRGISGLDRTHGAPRIYHVVGAANAEIPMTQISTYLAAGFMNRFTAMIGRARVNVGITKQKVDEWAYNMNLTPNGILARISHGTFPLMLPDVDKGILKSLGQMPRGKAPEPWAIPGNDFLDKSEGKRTANCNGLKEDIEDFSLDRLLTGQTASIISNIFSRLYGISTDPEFGPYYAAYLLHNNGYDLGKVVDGLIGTFEQQKGTQELYLSGRGTGGGIADDIVQVSTDYINAHFYNEKGAYVRYKQTLEDYFITINRIKELENAIAVMKTLKLQLNRLYQNYYVPMIEMLDNVKESFDEDLVFLQLPKAQQATAYTWQILKLADVQPALDQTIKALQPKTLVSDFIHEVMANYKEWINRNSDKITAFISKFMSESFHEQVNTSLQDYLSMKFKNAATPQDLAESIEREIIAPVFDQATAMFWCDPNFNIQADTFQTANLSVPASASAVCEAAENFAAHTVSTCTVRKTGLKDRIFAMRFFSGTPFYAYHGVDLLKGEYDSAKTGSAGAGVHLYAKTGRGTDGTGDKDWIHFLPTPIPYSKDPEMTENADEGIRIYNQACEMGIISPESTASSKWVLRVSKPIDEEKEYKVEEFLTRDSEDRVILDQVAINSARRTIEDRLAHGWEDRNLERQIVMKNDGAISYGPETVAAVRLDYFLSFPNQQKVAKNEIRKYTILKEQLKQLEKIESEYATTKQNLEEFCGLLFYDLLESEDYSGNKSYTKIARMYYPYKKGGVPMEEELTGQGDQFLYGKQYPLYQAFLTYTGLDRERMPREEILKKYNARKEEKIKKSDRKIARILENQWDDSAIRKLYRNVSALNEGADIIGFYTGLVQQIQEFKNKFDYAVWISDDDDKPASETPTPEKKPVLPVYVSDGNDTMQVYPDQYKNWAYSASRNQWVPLTPNMWVYVNNSWEPIKLDQQGNIII